MVNQPYQLSQLWPSTSSQFSLDSRHYSRSSCNIRHQSCQSNLLRAKRRFQRSPKRWERFSIFTTSMTFLTQRESHKETQWCTDHLVQGRPSQSLTSLGLRNHSGTLSLRSSKTTRAIISQSGWSRKTCPQNYFFRIVVYRIGSPSLIWLTRTSSSYRISTKDVV